MDILILFLKLQLFLSGLIDKGPDDYIENFLPLSVDCFGNNEESFSYFSTYSEICVVGNVIGSH